PSDAELVQLTLAGDEQAFTALYRRHQSFVYRFALLMSGRASIAEEVTQEVFLALLRKAHRYDPALGSLTSYLCGAARNHILRLLERERPYVQFSDDSDGEEAIPFSQLIDGDDPLRNCTRNEAIKLVRQAVLALPPRYREVIVLCDFQELTCTEAAQALECPVGTVNSRLHRGHALLLDKLLKKLRADGHLKSKEPAARRGRCFA
ncbi:MAG: RNA polymerase sigma factor, partial [Blastocatellia bacterium]|nr:RNA polymerase sigma factor [Blastocatellia bacterium]